MRYCSFMDSLSHLIALVSAPPGATIARADGLLRVPISSDGLPAGAEVEVLLL